MAINLKEILYISKTGETPSIKVIDIIKRNIDIKDDIKVFFTSNGLREFLEQIRLSYNMELYNIYYFNNKKNYGYWVKGRNFSVKNALGGENQRFPIKLSKFENFKEYKQIKYTSGKNETIYLIPTYYVVEFSKFIEDENAHIESFIPKFEIINNKWIIDYIHYLLGLYDISDERKSKVDYLANCSFYEDIEGGVGGYDNKIELRKDIYGYSYVSNENFANGNGLFLVRRNGKLELMIHFLVFNEKSIYLEIKKKGRSWFEFKNYKKNFYYYTAASKDNTKQKRIKNYFIFGKSTLKTSNNIPIPIRENKAIVLEEKDLPEDYDTVHVIYIVRKSFYPSENLSKSRKRSYRLKGVSIIYVIKRK